MPEIWYELLSKIDNQFLKQLLSDIDYVDIGNMISTDLRIVFNSQESFNLFNLSLRKKSSREIIDGLLNNILSSREIIEKLFSETFGEDVSIILDPPKK